MASKCNVMHRIQLQQYVRRNPTHPLPRPPSTPRRGSLRLLILGPNLRHISLRPRHRIRRRLLRNRLLPRHPRQPVKKQRAKDVKDDERPHDTEIPPARGILTAQRRQVDVRVGRGAEVAIFGCGGVGEVAA